MASRDSAPAAAEVTSFKVATWAYSQLEGAGGLTWRQGEEMVVLDSGWRQVLGN